MYKFLILSIILLIQLFPQLFIDYLETDIAFEVYVFSMLLIIWLQAAYIYSTELWEIRCRKLLSLVLLGVSTWFIYDYMLITKGGSTEKDIYLIGR